MLPIVFLVKRGYGKRANQVAKKARNAIIFQEEQEILIRLSALDLGLTKLQDEGLKSTYLRLNPTAASVAGDGQGLVSGTCVGSAAAAWRRSDVE